MTDDLRADVTAWLDGDEHTEEWDVDWLLRRCVDALAARTREVEAMREALTHYANSINWMTHTDQDDDNLRRVWVGSGDGREYARRALAAQEGTR